MLSNAAFAVLAEGRPVTPLLIFFGVIDLAWVVAALLVVTSISGTGGTAETGPTPAMLASVETESK